MLVAAPAPAAPAREGGRHVRFCWWSPPRTVERGPYDAIRRGLACATIHDLAAARSLRGVSRRASPWRACPPPASGSSAASPTPSRRTGALRAGEQALLLLSGGADSMALLSLLRAVDAGSGLGLRSRRCTWTTALRGADSDRDRAIVERACAAAGVPLHVERLRGRLAGARLPGARPRAALRARPRAGRGARLRRRRHRAQPRRPGGDVLYRLAKYASPRGLAGMRPRDGDLARPLLGVGAAEIRDVLPRRRDRVRRGRHQRRAAATRATCCASRCCPLLEALNPRVAETLAAAAEQAAAEADVLAAAPPRRARTGCCCRRRRATSPPSTSPRSAPSRRPCARSCCTTLLREAMGGDALVERRLVEALLRLAARADDAGRVEPRPRPRGGARRRRAAHPRRRRPPTSARRRRGGRGARRRPATPA